MIAGFDELQIPAFLFFPAQAVIPSYQTFTNSTM